MKLINIKIIQLNQLLLCLILSLPYDNIFAQTNLKKGFLYLKIKERVTDLQTISPLDGKNRKGEKGGNIATITKRDKISGTNNGDKGKTKKIDIKKGKGKGIGNTEGTGKTEKKKKDEEIGTPKGISNAESTGKTEKKKKDKEIGTSKGISNTEGTGGKKEGDEYKREKEKAEWIERTINFGIHKSRKYALNNILTIKNKNIKSQLEDMLIRVIDKERDIGVKIRAISVAGELKLKRSSPVIQKSLDDESEDVRIAAAYALQKTGDKTLVQALAGRLKKLNHYKNSLYIEALIDTLGVFKAKELWKFAIDIINDEKTVKNLRELYIIFLGKVGENKSKNFLMKLLQDEDEEINIRSLAVRSLSNLGTGDITVHIEEIVKQIESYPYRKKKKYYNLYIYCIAAMARQGDQKAIPHLLHSLKSDNAVIRLKSIKLLKGLKDQRIIDILKYKLKNDQSTRVRKAARDALKELGIDIDEEDEIDNYDEENKKLKNFE